MLASRPLTDSLTVSVEEAVARLCERAPAPQEELVTLPEAVGRVLARDCFSPLPLPPFRRAAMDGYAVRAADTLAAAPDRPLPLAVQAMARAGRAVEPAAAGANEGIAAVRVYTGAPVPVGFDAVVVQEMVTFAEGGRPQIDRPAAVGRHIAEAGEDIRAGERVLGRGTRIGAKELAILASLGMSQVGVYRRPRAVVLPIGDELTPPGRPLGPGGIYEANGFMIEARLRQLGADVWRQEPATDEAEALRLRLEQAWGWADVVVTIGGVSVGDYDYAKTAAEAAGARAIFTKVRMRPGTPTSAFARGDRTVIALSGNPAACYSGLELLAVPFVRCRMGEAAAGNEWLEGRLAEGVGKPCPYPRYVRSYAWMEDGRWRLWPLTGDKSGNIAAFAGANALAEVPAGGGGADAGQTVRWLRLN